MLFEATASHSPASHVLSEAEPQAGTSRVQEAEAEAPGEFSEQRGSLLQAEAKEKAAGATMTTAKQPSWCQSHRCDEIDDGLRQKLQWLQNNCDTAEDPQGCHESEAGLRERISDCDLYCGSSLLQAEAKERP